ncbi:MAG: START-like domain-containing protein [Rikenellaceae bacterium]
MAKHKITLEYLFNTTVQSLYRCISAPSGLSGWFADNITVDERNGVYYVFWWGKSSQKAKLIRSKTGSFVRFQWEDDLNTDYYFEMQITSDELTGVVSLSITDFAPLGDEADVKSMWDTNIKGLKLKIGSK